MNIQVIFDDLANGKPDFINYGMAIVGKKYKLEVYVRGLPPKLLKRYFFFWWKDTKVTGLRKLIDDLKSLNVPWINVTLGDR